MKKEIDRGDSTYEEDDDKEENSCKERRIPRDRKEIGLLDGRRRKRKNKIGFLFRFIE